MALWLAPSALVLASQSRSRRALMEAAGLPIEVCPADLDERGIEAAAASADPAAVARLLARLKAQHVSASRPGCLVVGADQTLALGVSRLAKPADLIEARAQLAALSGRTHELHSAVVVVADGSLLFEHAEAARLTMRQVSPGFLDDYLAANGRLVTTSVGGYQVEGLGIQLFERIEGDHFTILGLPLLPLLKFLRHHGSLAS